MAMALDLLLKLTVWERWLAMRILEPLKPKRNLLSRAGFQSLLLPQKVIIRHDPEFLGMKRAMGIF